MMWLERQSAKILLVVRRLRSLLSACMFAQAIGDGAVFTDVSVVVEGDQGEISTSESILTTE